jgi:hypothetical protein
VQSDFAYPCDTAFTVCKHRSAFQALSYGRAVLSATVGVQSAPRQVDVLLRNVLEHRVPDVSQFLSFS